MTNGKKTGAAGLETLWDSQGKFVAAAAFIAIQEPNKSGPSTSDCNGHSALGLDNHFITVRWLF